MFSVSPGTSQKNLFQSKLWAGQQNAHHPHILDPSKESWEWRNLWISYSFTLEHCSVSAAPTIWHPSLWGLSDFRCCQWRGCLKESLNLTWHCDCRLVLELIWILQRQDVAVMENAVGVCSDTASGNRLVCVVPWKKPFVPFSLYPETWVFGFGY